LTYDCSDSIAAKDTIQNSVSPVPPFA